MRFTNALLAPAIMPSTSPLPVDSAPTLSRLRALIEQAGHRCALLGDPGAQHRADGGDFDIAISIPRLSIIHAIVNRFASEHGCKILQCIRHEKSAWYFVLGGFGPDGEWRLLKLDFCHDFRRNGRLYVSADELLNERSRSAKATPLPVPAAASNFACCLAKAMDKQSLDTTRARFLSRLWLEDPAGCRRAVEGFWHGQQSERLAAAAASGQWETIIRDQALYCHWLHRRRTVSLSGWLAEITLRTERILRPPGFIVALAGGPADIRQQLLDRLVLAFGPAFYGVRTIPPPLRHGFISAAQIRVQLGRGRLLIWPAPAPPPMPPTPARDGICFLLADGAVSTHASAASGRAILLRLDQSVDNLAKTAIAAVANRLASRMDQWTPASSRGEIPS